MILEINTLHSQKIDTTAMFVPEEENRVMAYNKYTVSKNPSYDLSGLWDFDGDGTKDSFLLVGNGGVHVYYHFMFVISSQPGEHYFLPDEVMIDLPYPSSPDSLEKYGKTPAIQFVVCDFNKDDRDEVYINFDNSFVIFKRRKWRRGGIESPYVVYGFEKGRFLAREYMPGNRQQ